MFPIQAGNLATTPYADDVFSAYLYGGNASVSIAVNNGINLAGKGGLVWVKKRSPLSSDAFDNHILADSASGVTKRLFANATDAQSTGGFLSSFDSSGFTVEANGYGNQNSQANVAWTFRKAAKFFDVVTYTGTGSLNTISHALGIAPGCIIVKATNSAVRWFVYHSSIWASATQSVLTLNSNNGTGALADYGDNFGYSAPTSASFDVNYSINSSGTTYVAYLFAHDVSTTGLIQCGSFTTDGSGNASVTSLGWEPQFIMVKASSTTGDWIMLDSTRAWDLTANDALLRANLTNAETTTTNYGNPTSTGFDFKGGSASATYVYMAIRRPNKPPTVGTSVFALNTATTSGASIASPVNSVDLAILANRAGDAKNFQFADRVRGFQVSTTSIADSFTTPTLVTSGTAAESTASNAIYQRDGSGAAGEAVSFSTSGSASRVWYAFKRAPGFFDVVGYTGTGANRTVSHNLGAVPELMIVKGRSAGSTNWSVYAGTATQFLVLNSTAIPSTNSTFWNNTSPTSSVFSLGNSSDVNNNTTTYIAYLFATLPGISKVGTYTGNGSSQTINAGFTTGARFILIKRTDTTGDWIVWDTARGIVSANDPYLALNTTVAEVTTDDSVDPNTSGFIVNQVAATNINVTSATYLYLAIA